MQCKWMVVLLASLAANVVMAGDKISSLSVASYDSHDRAMLPNAFITGVDSYLRRYAPKLIKTERSHVTMHVNYAYPYDVELYVTPGEFQIMVTLSEDVLRKEQARATAEKVSAGVLKAMQKSLARSRKKRDGR